MRVTTKLNAISAITIGALVTLIPILIWSVGQSIGAKNDLVLADMIQSNFFERASLRNQYFLYREKHTRTQWEENKQIADRLLEQAKSQFQRQEDRQAIERLRQNINETAAIFQRLVINSEVLESVPGKREVLLELDKRLSSQLLLKASAVSDSISALKDTSAQRVEQAYERLAIMAALLAGMLAIATFLVSASLVRLVRQRLAPLHDGAKIIGSGDLNYRIKSDGADEFAELAESVNAMTDKLVTEITERRRLEGELEQHRRHLEALVAQRTEALLVTEARASHLLQSSADGLYGVDPTGKITFINPAACEMLGYRPEQTIGRSAHVLFHHSKPDGSPFPIDECRGHDAVLGGHQMRVDNEVYWHVDGHAVPVMYAIHPIIQEGRTMGAVISFVDMSEQRAAAEAREQALLAAEHLARVRSEFLANMSHEIRTPLNGVLGFAEIGQRNFMNSEKALNAFTKILSSGNLLLGVINDILDFSKIEAGKIRIELAEVSIVGVMGQALELVGERARAKGVVVRVERAGDLPQTCLTDRLRLSQILLNLLSNAVKFTEHGSVTLSAARLGNDLVFTVSDTGIGMSADQLALLFNPFQQADSSTTRRFGGTGLGLAISKRILELMGGSIWAESRPDIGSTFEFRVPYLSPNLSPNLPAADAAQPSIPQYEPGTPGPYRPLAGISILVAEDEPINQLVIEDNLTEDGATVVMVNNGREAVERVLRDGAQAYDVVLMDIQMPEMDGYEATRLILERAPELPVIGQTAHASSEERDRCLAAGMVGHIAKPINAQALAILIRQHIAPGTREKTKP